MKQEDDTGDDMGHGSGRKKNKKHKLEKYSYHICVETSISISLLVADCGIVGDRSLMSYKRL